MKNFSGFLVFLILANGFWGCKEELSLQKISGQNIEIEDSISDNDEINNFIEPYKSSIEDEMNKPLSYTPKAMFKSDTPYNTAIGNMMADAVFEMANPIFFSRFKDSIDGVLLNYGGIRAGISKGVITTETAYSIMPFENMVVVAKLKGIHVNEMFQYLARSKKAQPISNMSVAVDESWNLKKYRISNKEIDTSKYYYIATSDYLSNGGDNMEFFHNADSIYQTDYKLRTLLIDYFNKKDTLRAEADNRFQKI
jgi:2',3'-cyclic-nucleotide 2'-phosphodiesterase (5'-nucleotidase family)